MMSLEQRISMLEATIAALTKSDRYTFSKHLQLFDGKNFQLGKSVGTQIGTEADQLLAFFGADPVVQWDGVGEDAHSTGTGSNVTTFARFPGNYGGSTYTIGDIARALINYGLLKP